MVQLYQDAMAIVRKLGKPDYFVTFTCNAAERIDICSRVFRLKLDELLHDLSHKQILGRVSERLM